MARRGNRPCKCNPSCIKGCKLQADSVCFTLCRLKRVKNKEGEKVEETKKMMPIIPLRGITVFPNMIIHFDIGREKSLKAVEAAMLQEEKILLVTQKDASLDSPTAEELYAVGTVAKIKQVGKLKQPTIKILVEGETRATGPEIVNAYYLNA